MSGLKGFLCKLTDCFGMRTDPLAAQTIKSNLTYSNGDIYEGLIFFILGEVSNGKRNGFGTLILANKDKYQGQWKNDLKHGIGYYYYANGEFYKGDW